jgi:hypothetical protein
LGDPKHIISYIWTHLGFIPVDILVVAFILDEIIEKNNVYGEDEQPQIDQMSIFEFIGEKNG